jgi:hypothetical protein
VVAMWRSRGTGTRPEAPAPPHRVPDPV